MTTASRALLRLYIGHRSEMLDRPTPEGHTHRWTVFVRSAGQHQFVDRSFITKVVFELHPDFANPHRVVKEPPFEVTETGYAGFSIPVYVSFSGTSKTYRLHYDMNLCLEKQSEHKVEQILEIKQPSSAFYGLIMKYGGVMKKEKKKEKHRPKEKELVVESHKKEREFLEEPKLKKERNKENKEQLEEMKNRKEKEPMEDSRVKKEKEREPPEEVKTKREEDLSAEETPCSEGTKSTDAKEEMDKRKEKERLRASDSEEREKTKRMKTWNDDQLATKKTKFDEAELESLVALQRKLMTLYDVERLQAIVEAIIASGPASGLHAARTSLSEDNFLSFDLCALSTSLISQFEEICSRKV